MMNWFDDGLDPLAARGAIDRFASPSTACHDRLHQAMSWAVCGIPPRSNDIFLEIDR
jgi:hypothetical protein